MELSDALKNLIRQYGVEIIYSKNFINCLDDLKAFKDTPVFKSILRHLVSKGYIEEYLSIFDVKQDVLELIHDIHYKDGYDKTILLEIFNAFQLAFGRDLLMVNDKDIESDNLNITQKKEKRDVNAGGINLDLPFEDTVQLFIQMDYEIRNINENVIELNGTYCGIENTQVRIEKDTKTGTTKLIRASIPIQGPDRDKFIVRQMAKQLTEANGIPKVAKDFLDQCEIIGNTMYNTQNLSEVPFFFRWELEIGNIILAYLSFNIEFSVSKN